MLKIALVLVCLAVAAANGQGPESASAPEPYAYNYETESHSASEQRDPSGRVTGFYTIADADGRSRRVEYYADESGFHAKVQTNEVGTESKSSADVEVLASPPTPEQFAAYQSVQQASGASGAAFGQQAFGAGYGQQSGQRFVQQGQQYFQPGQPANVVSGGSYHYAQQPPQYNAGYGYAVQGANQYQAYPSASSQYYKSSSSSSSSGAPSVYGAGVSKYASSSVVPVAGSGSGYSSYSSHSGVVPVAGSGSGYSSYSSQQSSGPNVGAYSNYQALPVGAGVGSVSGGYRSSSSRSSSSSSGPVSQVPFGSPNYLVLKKRDASPEAKAASSN